MCLWASASQGEATLVSVHAWHEDVAFFGGFSGLEVSADGNTFFALNDQGGLAFGTFTRTDGVITAVHGGALVALNDLQNVELVRGGSDSEGLAFDPAGGFWVSFEGPARVWHYDGTPNTPAQSIPRDPSFATMQSNAALEALAIGPDGALYTLPERSGRASRPFPVLRYRDGEWTKAFDIPRRGEFVASGADFGPDGRFYLLERDVLGILFRTRIRRFNADGTGEETILQSRIGEFDNLEGIAVWQAADGIRLTLISDDNFNFFQQTQIVEFRLSD